MCHIFEILAAPQKMEEYEAAGMKYESIPQSIDLAYNNLLIRIIMYEVQLS